MHKASPTEMMMMMKMQKDAELDKKIEALRKKNEALMKRYQEVEEDKKRAELEGMSLPSRKGKPDDLTITLNKSSNEQRVVTKKSNLRSEQQKEHRCFSVGRGNRRQLLITTSGNIKGKRVFGERKDRNRPVSPVRRKLCPDEDQEKLDSITPDQPTPATKRIVEIQEDAGEQERSSRCEESQCDQATEGPNPAGVADLSLLASQEEQVEYLRWKKEREEIDRERVARHKNSKGQWRRAWDVEKPADLIYSNKSLDGPDRETQNTGNRVSKRGNLRSEESRAHHQGRKCHNVPVMGSKAKGKDRLTGRARRWDTKEQEEHLQVYPDCSLQEFLEELDVLCAPEEKNINPESKKQDGIQTTKLCASKVPLKPEEVISNVTSDRDLNGCVSTETPHSETSGPKTAEKKVRFLEDILDRAHEKNSNSVTTETRVSSLKTPSQVPDNSEENKPIAQNHNDSDLQNEKMVSVSLTSIEKIRSSEPDLITEGNDDEPSEALSPSTSSEHGDVCISAEPGQNQPMELTKNCSSRGTEDLMDSSLSVLNLESGESLSEGSTGADMARENGKVV